MLKATQFAAMVLTAVTLVPLGAHLAALPNKIDLARTDYFIVQNVYRGWALFGIAMIGAVLANLALAALMRHRGAGFALVTANLVCLVGALAIFFAFTYPANEATDNWTAVPLDWEGLRWQWEMSHAASAVLVFGGFCMLTWSLLTRE